jgi:hypothetical protein
VGATQPAKKSDMMSARMTDVMKFRRRRVLGDEDDEEEEEEEEGSVTRESKAPLLLPPSQLTKLSPPLSQIDCLHGRYKPPGGARNNCVSRCDLELSCNEMCKSVGKQCSKEKNDVFQFLNHGNSCKQLIAQFPCETCEQGWGADLPAFRVWNYDFGQGKPMGMCYTRSNLAQSNPHSFMCSGSFSNSHRLCPCVPVQQDNNEFSDFYCKHVIVDPLHVRGGSIRIRSYLRQKQHSNANNADNANNANNANSIEKKEELPIDATKISERNKLAHANIKCQLTQLPFLFDQQGRYITIETSRMNIENKKQFEEMQLQLTTEQMVEVKMAHGPSLKFNSGPTSNLVDIAHVSIVEVEDVEWDLRRLQVRTKSAATAGIKFLVVVEGRSIVDDFFTARLTGPTGFYQWITLSPSETPSTHDTMYQGHIMFPTTDLKTSFQLIVSYLGQPLETQMCSTSEVQDGTNCRSKQPIAITLLNENNEQKKSSNHAIIENNIDSDYHPVCGQTNQNIRLSGKGSWRRNVWVPEENCRFKQFAQNEIRQCLMNKEIIIFGDSHMRGVYQALLDSLSDGARHHRKFQEDAAVNVGQTSVRFWWTNSAFFSPPHLKTLVENCTPTNCLFFGGFYLAELGTIVLLLFF